MDQATGEAAATEHVGCGSRPGGGFFALRPPGSRAAPRSSAATEIGGKFGVLAERSAGSDGTPKNDAQFLGGRGDDVWVVTFLRCVLVEEIAVCAAIVLAVTLGLSLSTRD